MAPAAALTPLPGARLDNALRRGRLSIFRPVTGPHSPRAGRGIGVRLGCRSATTMKSTARFLVGGNWKCNGDRESIVRLVADLNSGDVPSDVEVVCAPPFVYLDQVSKALMPPYQVAAQNCWVGKGGAFTGEVSAEMLSDCGVGWVILGHSERRALCGEDSQFVGKKVAYALEQGLRVIACIGETLEQRESGEMFNVLEEQMGAIAENVSDWGPVVIAYEPVWAIGTGVVATPDQAQEVHAYLRKWVTEKVGAGVADSLRILYGGSVNDANCVELAGQEDIDGFLVGGASLKGAAFVKICNAQSAATVGA
ncbi:unnamed protein product [Ostreobium quekettii]|uniref:Triosephosphate isomerase n=1 Tax=Ostreobium quekettii TaxID=121088 RepID=A0A8S1IWA6_9CHLO|nr:unnamed protein product [Ostreobium quekettii]|eukprot:evm.model.scf_156.6 EVM.evm.TU.scf_156.6   scf_156:48148-49077(+)